MAILRSVGARPLDVLWLLCVEGLGVMLCGVLAAPGMLLLIKVAPWHERPAGSA